MRRFIAAWRAFFKVFRHPQLLEQLEKTTASEQQNFPGALQLLGVLQEEGRLIDFLQEDIDEYEDEQVGAAVRDIHDKTAQSLRKYAEIVPILDKPEGEETKVSEGFDPEAIKLVGNVTGKPPFTGMIRHQGWQVKSLQLPQENRNLKIIVPAEVEI